MTAKERITFEQIDSFILAIDRATNLDQIPGILEKQIQTMGFDKFTYWLRWPSQEQKRPIFISTYPEKFIEHYIANDFQSHDMVGRFSMGTNVPFSWSKISNVLPLTRVQQHLFDTSRSVGMGSGGSVPIHGPSQIKATFSVTNDMSHKEFDELFVYHRHELHLIATYAHEKIMGFDLDKPLNRLSLTQRETEILTWVSRGKTYWEISRILSIQENTVRNHMQNICHGLNVSNSTHAATKAIIYGLIIP
ncbi:MAG: autoinducer binding domain-containing protein [Alphaproteobacteria bacterium]|nr:autoinducer binding domain-containing protein [Alphaproteobacteria bacterium]